MPRAAEWAVRVKPQHRVDVGRQYGKVELAGLDKIALAQRADDRLALVPQLKRAFESLGGVCRGRRARAAHLGKVQVLLGPAVRAAPETVVVPVAVKCAGGRAVVVEWAANHCADRRGSGVVKAVAASVPTRRRRLRGR